MKNDLLNQLYADYYQELRRYVTAEFGLNAAESEDIVQLTFVKFAKVLGSLESKSNFRAYLFRIAHNCVIDEKRRNVVYSHAISSGKVEGVPEDGVPQSNSDQTLNNPERIHCAQQQLDFIRIAIQAMPAQRQKYLKMSRFDCLSNVEIAKREGISETAVRKHIARGLLDIKSALNSHVTEFNT